MLVFNIKDAKDLKSTDINLFFPVGLPKGHDIIRKGISLEPKLVSISPSVGSLGGTLVSAVVPGVGTSTTGVDLVGADGKSICRDPKQLKITAYSKIECWTRFEALGEGAQAISVKQGEGKFECAANDKVNCQYTQGSNADNSFPTIDSLAIKTNTLVMTGKGFYTKGYKVTASYSGIQATFVDIDSATQATATWIGGVPIFNKAEQDRDERANLIFQLENSNTYFKAVNTAAEVSSFTNKFTFGSSSSGLKCSFNGGCELEMTGTSGVQTLIRDKPAENYISVCEQKCVYENSGSTAEKIKCKLPAVPTTYSNNNFQIGKVEQELNSGVYFGVEDAKIAFDGSVFTRVNNNDNKCIVGMEFKQQYVGSLKQVKYFINYITDRKQYVDNLVFEGYNDAKAEGEAVTELFRVTEGVHEGWNYVDFEEGKYPNYRYYRFRGLGGAAGPCRIHELTLSGIEVIENKESTYSCKPKLHIGKDEPIEFTNAVTYQGDLTPLLSKIEPRFGSRLGGDDVTFTGT